jgi:energy-coupling factor transporter ATP-binding protein EcfA2
MDIFSFYRLMNNISITTTWVPLTTSSAFRGIFVGNNYTISGVDNLGAVNNVYIGLFGNNVGTIKNLTVSGTLTPNYENTIYIGLIAGFNNGTINNCHSSGSVNVNGKDTKKTSIFEIGKDIGYVFQNPDHQIFADTVYDEVAFSPKIRGCSKEEIDKRVKEALKSVDMEGYEQEDPFSLTKGERQRIAVASILSARPKVIILDEPTTGLDYKEQRRMMELVKKLNESGHTIIMITHTMWVVAEYAHRVAVIKDGLMTMYGKTREVFKREEELLESYLKTPHIVNMSNMLGNTVLSVKEMIACTKGAE